MKIQKYSVLLLLIALSFNLRAQEIPLAFESENGQLEFVLYNELTQKDVSHMTGMLEDNYDRVLEDFGIRNLRTVTVKIWRDYQDFIQVYEDTTGEENQSLGYVTWAQNPEVRIMYFPQLIAARNLVHEFTHITSMAINFSIPNNPRWLWEAVAQYEAGDLRGGPRNLDYLVAGNFPSLEVLNTDFRELNGKTQYIYEVGYILCEYIVQEWGKEAIYGLIRSNGNIPETLSVTVSDFESGWHEFIVQNYLGK